MSEEKLVPKLRFSGFDEDWVSYKIGDISKTYSGGTPSTSKREYYKGNIPFIKSGEIGNEVTEQYINEEAINNSSAKKVQKGDLLLALYGATSGEVAISKIDGAINQAVLKIDNKMNNYFQYNYFVKYKDQIIHKYLQGGQGNLSANIIKKLEFYYPNLEEQQKISNYLLLIDNKIELLEKKHNEYQNFKKYLMQQIFAQKLRFLEFTKVWKSTKIGEIADIVGGGTPRTEVEEYWDGEIKWFTPSEIGKTKYIFDSKRHITDKGLKNSSAKLLPKDTILLSSRATVGEISIALTECSTNQGFQSLITKNNVDNDFIYYLISTIKNEFLRRSSGSTFLEISKNEIKRIPINIPELSEQNKISNLFSAIDNKIEMLEKKHQYYQDFKKYLMQRIFSSQDDKLRIVCTS